VDYWIKCGGGPRTPWFVSWEIHVSFLDKGVLSLQVTRDRFTNANGTPLRSFNVHFGLPDLRQLTRDSFFVAGYEAYLDSIGERAFRSGVRLTEDADLASAGYTEFGNGQFSLNSNFEILDSGLQFMFNAYEIASGAYGWSFVHLPWDQLRPIIRPGGPLEWVLREE
ncbi:MAG: RsiV family protein, partial [candidate division Zixibacteria bacterium]|nr:RsiV family protein [candidate division Zixibacteria bacterium]